MDPPLPSPQYAHRRRCSEYLLALEEERRKIQVFKRELPLCLQLVTQTIEGMKSQMHGVGSEGTVSDHGPVLEEFMPLKPSLSLSSDEHESADDAAATNDVGKKEKAAETHGRQSPPTEANKAMPDWLQSVQLWSQEPQQQPSSPRKELLCKPVALNTRKAGDAFQPFVKEKRAEMPASPTTAAAGSAVVGDSCDKVATDTSEKHSDKEMNKDAKDMGKYSKDKEGQSQAPNRKPRRCWAPELHRRFLQALQQLGGSHGSFNLMACLKEIPILKGNNYTEWRKKIEFSFVCGEVDWVLTTPQPQAPQKPVRADGDDDAAWQQKERDYAPLELAYTLENKQWTTANKKCMALVKNTIEPAILGSIAECDSVSEYLDKIRNQFTGSSKIYATQLFKQLATERYNGGGTGIRDHIMRMYNLAAQLKPMDLELKPGHIMHLVFASLPKEFDTFVVNYNMQPEQWDMEKMIAMCVQEEDRLRSSHGGSLHYVKDNRKKIANPSFKARGKAPMQQNHQKLLPVDKDQCLHCKKKGHFKKDCPDWLKSIMAKRGIPFDEDYAKKRKMR